MKTKLIILTILLTVGGLLYFNQQSSADTLKDCPEGSYNIGETKNGEIICKLEPTGCPYADSLPMDKCEPETQNEVEVIVESEIIEQPILEGK